MERPAYMDAAALRALWADVKREVADSTPMASASAAGLVRVGAYLTVSNGALTIDVAALKAALEEV